MASYRTRQPRIKVYRSVQQSNGTSRVEATQFTARQATLREREVQQKRQEHADELARARASLLASFDFGATDSRAQDLMDVDEPEQAGPDDALNGWEDVQDATSALLEAYRMFRVTARPHRRRDWAIDRARVHENWASQLDALVDAYLELLQSSTAARVPPVSSTTPTTGTTLDPSTAPSGSSQIYLVDLYGCSTVARSSLTADRVNLSLVRLGYLGSTPIHPNVAFSLRTLLAYHRLKLRARASKQGFVQALCDLGNIPYSRWLKSRFSDALDTFLSILRAIDDRVNTVLSRDNVWRMKNSCPACAYECVDEELLLFKRQFTMDGNDSFKRFETPGIGYERMFPSRYVLSHTEVDLRANEVPRRRAADDVDAAGTDDNHECGTRWRAARPDGEKVRSWEVLDETGIFVCMCRHGVIVVASDMWKSGELAKYPLAIIKKLIDLFGVDALLMMGYDIGCAHSGTAARSSFGALVKQCIRFVVGSFHGHAHNRPCQIGFHPRNVVGAGREPFEGCEQLFSHSNLFAFLMRHASKYHRLEDIDYIFSAWDADKYARLGELLLTKFRDAKAKVDEHRVACAVASGKGIGRVEFEQFLADELAYLRGRQTAVEEDASTLYVKTLRKWWAVQADLQRLNSRGAPSPDDRAWVAAVRKSVRLDDELQSFETRYNYVPRWTKESAEYSEETRRAAIRTYELAVDKLERAVVSRLFELEKAYVRGTGYKLRKQIGKALSKRSTALRNALQKYNVAAAALPTPRPPLAFQEILDATFLDDIPLLRESREDVLNQPWARPEARRLTTAWLETERSMEELKRVRVESVRIRAWIRDEETLLNETVARLGSSASNADRLLATELDARADLLFKIHSNILADLDKMDSEDGVQPRKAGLREGQPASLADRVRPLVRLSRQVPITLAHAEDDDAEDDADGDGDEEEQHELDALVTAVTHMLVDPPIL